MYLYQVKNWDDKNEATFLMHKDRYSEEQFREVIKSIKLKMQCPTHYGIVDELIKYGFMKIITGHYTLY